MRGFLSISAVTIVSAAMAFAANTPSTALRGEYIEARTADVYTGLCFANGEANQVGDLAVFGWTIQQGEWQGVPLEGLSVVGVVKASGTLGAGSAYPVKSVLIVDERANPEQRAALTGFAHRMGGDLLQDVTRVYYQPITFSVRDNNLHTAAVTLTAGPLARIQTRALTEADQICHHEDTYYPPLTALDHAMPAFTLANSFQGAGLGTTWNSPGKRSAYVGSFRLD